MAALIGLSLGLFGGGGSVLTVPVLVYMLGIDPVISTGYSLFIVGFASMIGAFKYFKNDLVDLRTAAVFGIPAIIGVYFSRKFLMPWLPDQLFLIDDFIFTKNIAIMVLFAVLMIVASFAMIKGRTETSSNSAARQFNYPLILIEGLSVGVLTGMVGAGGGFLIIPALVVLAKLPMKMAVGTSLLIIATKSLIGFIGDVQNHYIDWQFLLMFSVIAVIGVFGGTALSNLISGQKLKPIFGWFVLVIGVAILGRELLF